MELNQFLTKIINQQDLTAFQAETLLEIMIQGSAPASQIAAILTALRIKGESTAEIVGFIKVMRQHTLKVKADGVVIDTCGTGGDGKRTFNISTAVAFVVAGAGVKVAKHGNKGVSSQSGSADVLEALTADIRFSPEQAAKLLHRVGITFLFAPLFHPAMAAVAKVRRELKVRTIFNLLGPFVNPAGVGRQLVGVPSKEVADRLGHVALNLSYDHLLIVSSKDGLDEISLSAPTHFVEVKGKKIKDGVIDPGKLGFKKCSLRAIAGGNAMDNANIIKKILIGELGPRRDIILLNSAASLYVAGKVKEISPQGIALAAKSIDSGRAKQVLEEFIRESNLV